MEGSARSNSCKALMAASCESPVTSLFTCTCDHAHNWSDGGNKASALATSMATSGIPVERLSVNSSAFSTTSASQGKSFSPSATAGEYRHGKSSSKNSMNGK